MTTILALLAAFVLAWFALAVCTAYVMSLVLSSIHTDWCDHDGGCDV